MADKIVILEDENGNNIYPITRGLAANSVDTNAIQDGAVTSSKIDWATIDPASIGLSSMPFADIFTPASGFSIIPNSRVFRIGSIYFGYVGVNGTVPSGSALTTVGTFKKVIKSNTVNIGSAGGGQWDPLPYGALIFIETSNNVPSMFVRVTTNSVAMRWWFYADLTDTPYGQ